MKWLTVFVAVFFLISQGHSAAAQPDPDLALRKEAQRQTSSIQSGGSDWPILETQFFIIHHQSPIAPSPVACLELDNFVSRLLRTLNVAEVDQSNLQRHKLSYYLCDDKTVTKLTGYTTKGMADLAGRAVISSHFPHFHELAHLLVNLSLTEAPLQTLPLIQEGLACLLGGRWGRAPATILFTGWVHHNFEMGQIAEVLSQSDFYTCAGGTDVTYPLGAMLCETIRRRAGWAGLMELYSRMSGSVEKVASLEAAEVIAEIADVCRWQADAQLLNREMNPLWAEYRRCGIAPITQLPVSKPKPVLSGRTGTITVWQENDLRVVHVEAQSYPVYLVSSGVQTERSTSSLFAEHLPGVPYHGQRYGLRCTPDDIAMYDFATNQLLATWVAGFTDEINACDDGKGGLIFEISGAVIAVLDSIIGTDCTLISI